MRILFPILPDILCVFADQFPENTRGIHTKQKQEKRRVETRTTTSQPGGALCSLDSAASSQLASYVLCAMINFNYISTLIKQSRITVMRHPPVTPQQPHVTMHWAAGSLL